MSATIPTQKAAHFLRLPVLADSPPNEAIVHALLECGLEVDLFVPGGSCETSRYGPTVSAQPVEYGRRWLLENAFSPRWRKYSVFSGNTEDPMGVVGMLAFLHRRPSFALADEIFSGSFRGNAPENWKRLCRWGMRRAEFNIVNDPSRIELQREYAAISDDGRIIVYPGAFRETPAPGVRASLRQKWGIPGEALVIAVSGNFDQTMGAEWLLKALQDRAGLHCVIQPVALNAMSRILLGYIRGRERVYVEDRKLGWQEAWASAVGVDIGLAIYLNQGPQFQRMGTSSNRLCMFLSMGVPVIASRQPSFEFLEQYECGVLVDSYEEFLSAIERIRQNMDRMKVNARACARNYIDSQGHYADLAKEVRWVLE